jgi:hypothetical protein
MAVTHYLEALDLQKEIVKIHSIFGGKNPHPNWLVGGVPCPINVHGTGAVGAISMERLNHVARIVQQSAEFVNNVYIPDVIAIGGFYRNWLHGGGLSSQAVMSYGDIPENGPMTIRPPTCSCPPVRSPTAICPRSTRSMSATPSRSRNSSTILGTNTASPAWACIPGTVSPSRISSWAPTPSAAAPISARSTRPRSIRGSRPRAGAATRWRSARWPATSWAMPRGTSGSPTRSRAFCAPWTCRSRRCSRRSVAPRPARSRRSIAPSCSSTSSTS